MKKIIVFFLFTTLFFVNESFAQDQRGRGRGQGPNAEQRKAHMEQMIAQIGLSDDQTLAMKDILQDYRKKMRDARDENMGDRIAMMEAMKNLRTEQESEVKDILTAEQFEKYKQIQKEQMEKRRARRGDRRSDF